MVILMRSLFFQGIGSNFSWREITRTAKIVLLKRLFVRQVHHRWQLFSFNCTIFLISSVKRIFMSIFAGKFIFPIFQKYFSRALSTYLLLIYVSNFAILSSILSSIIYVVSQLFSIRLSEFAGYTTAFLLYKRLWLCFSSDSECH